MANFGCGTRPPPIVSNFMGTDLVLCYAESIDGIHWEKTERSLIDYKGSTADNVVRWPPKPAPPQVDGVAYNSSLHDHRF